MKLNSTYHNALLSAATVFWFNVEWITVTVTGTLG